MFRQDHRHFQSILVRDELLQWRENHQQYHEPKRRFDGAEVLKDSPYSNVSLFYSIHRYFHFLNTFSYSFSLYLLFENHMKKIENSCRLPHAIIQNYIKLPFTQFYRSAKNINHFKTRDESLLEAINTSSSTSITLSLFIIYFFPPFNTSTAGQVCQAQRQRSESQPRL